MLEENNYLELWNPLVYLKFGYYYYYYYHNILNFSNLYTLHHKSEDTIVKESKLSFFQSFQTQSSNFLFFRGGFFSFYSSSK